MDIHEIEKEKRSLVQDRTDLEIAIKECEEAIKKREDQFTEAQGPFSNDFRESSSS